jgi:hypothetical protein
LNRIQIIFLPSFSGTLVVGGPTKAFEFGPATSRIDMSRIEMCPDFTLFLSLSKCQ